MIVLKKKCLVFFVFLILFGACTRNEIIGTPWNNPQIPVVYSVISPNEPVQVYLSKTYNSNFSIEKNPYPEAKVFICNKDSNWIELTRLKADTNVFADAQKTLSIEIGQTYSLKIELENSTIHSQTTVPPTPAILGDVTCEVAPSLGNYSYNMMLNGKYVKANNSYLSAHFNLSANSDCGYALIAFSEELDRSNTLTGNSYSSVDFFTPQDTSSFILDLITFDPYLTKYKLAESINSFEQDQWESIVLVLTMTYGGVLPPFSNIQNGVGLFGSYVTDSKQVEIIKATN